MAGILDPRDRANRDAGGFQNGPLFDVHREVAATSQPRARRSTFGRLSS